MKKLIITTAAVVLLSAAGSAQTQSTTQQQDTTKTKTGQRSTAAKNGKMQKKATGKDSTSNMYNKRRNGMDSTGMGDSMNRRRDSLQ